VFRSLIAYTEVRWIRGESQLCSLLPASARQLQTSSIRVSPQLL